MEPIEVAQANSNQIDLSQTPGVEPIDLSRTTPVERVTPDVASVRAFKAQYGIKDFKTFGQIYTEMLEGKDPLLRQEATAHVNARNSINLNDIVIETARRKGSALTEEEYKYINSVVDAYKPITDPTRIFEDMYSTEYINSVDATINGDSFLDTAKKKDPAYVATAKGAATELTSKFERINWEIQKNQEILKNQSYVGYGLDMAKLFSQVYQEFKFRGSVPGVSKWQGLFGSQMQIEARETILKPMPEFDKILSANMEIFNKDNPAAGAVYLQLLKGQSADEKLLNNVFTITAVPFGTAAIAGPIIAQKAIRAQVNTALAGMVRSAATETNPSGASVAAAAGDLTEAAMGRLRDLDLNPDATRAGLGQLTSDFTGATERFVTGSPNASREIVSRITELNNTTAGRLSAGVSETLRADRLADALSSDAHQRQIHNIFKDQFPNQTVLDLPPSRKDPISGTIFQDIHIGKSDGTFFSNAKEAETVLKNSGWTGQVVGSVGEQVTKKTEVQHSFTTGKEKYTVHADGTTTRSPILKKGEKAKGPAPEQSKRTVYVTKDAVTETGKAMKATEGGYTFRLAIVDGGISFLRRSVDEPWQETHRVPFSTQPEKGLIAVELGSHKRLQGNDTYGKAYIGDLITDVVQPGIIEQHGRGFYIRLPSYPFNETGVTARSIVEAVGKTVRGKTPNSWISAYGGFLGKYGTPDSLLSMIQNEARKVANTAPERVFELIKENLTDIQKLKSWSSIPFTDKRRKWKEFEAVMEASTKIRDPVTGKDGYLFQTLPEIQQLYMNTVRRLPDDQEIAAAFSWRNQQLSLNVLYNIFGYRDKARKGFRTFDFHIPEQETERSVKYRMLQNIDGKQLKSFDETSDDTFMFIGSSPGDIQLKSKANIKAKFREQLIEDIQQGKRLLIQVADTMGAHFDSIPQVKANNAKVRFVVTDKVNDKPLSWDQYKGPRPLDYDYQYTIAQPVISMDGVSKKFWYTRDKTFWSVNIAAMGKDVIRELEVMRNLIKEGKMDEARAANPLPVNFDELLTKIDINEPFQLVPKNKMVGDVTDLRSRPDYKGNFRDGSKEGYGKTREGVRDTYELFTIENTGTRANPVYNVTPGQPVNAVSAMNRAINNAVNQLFMDDYKLASVEQWIQEAKDLLKATPGDLADAPFHHFYKPEWKAGLTGDDLIRKNNLEIANYHMRQFMGVYDPVQTSIHAFTQSLADSVYTKGSSRLALAVPYTVSALTRVPDILRYMTFHAKLGLFNVPQLFVQMQTFVTTAAIAGMKYAAPGAKATLFHKWASLNSTPEFMQKLDNMASTQLIPGTARFKPGEFLEANQMLRESGWGHVGGRYAVYDNPEGFEIATHGGKKLLNWGKWFFTEGEKNVRIAAYYTAYLERRATKTTGKFDDADKAWVLNRADTLSVNMTTASNSKMHTGIMSVPAQFYTYMLRMTDLALGRRLTPSEKWRLWYYNAAMYGVPTSLGLTGFPAGDYLRQYGLTHGYEVGDSFIETAVMDGIPSAIVGHITGQYYNIPERFGTGGFEQIREIQRGDLSVLKIIGGAAGTVLANTLENADGFTQFVMSIFRDDDSRFVPTRDHFFDAFKEISAANSSLRLAAAWNYGKWLSKKGATLAEGIDPWEATFMSIFGLQPQKVSDMGLYIAASKDQKALQDLALKKIVSEARRALLDQDDINKVQTHINNIKAWFAISDYPIEKMDEALAIAFKGHEALADKIKHDFLTRDVPASQAQERLRRLIRQQGK